MVVIDLAADENAQEIFETLNARGAQLTAADLIKNFVFQRLLEAGADVEDAYERYWKEFETAFWETEVSVGRLRYPRSSIFLNHWLVARTGEEVVAREVFTRFKSYADFDAGVPMIELLEQAPSSRGRLPGLRRGAARAPGPIDRLGPVRVPDGRPGERGHQAARPVPARSRGGSRFPTEQLPRPSTSSRAGWSGGCSCGDDEELQPGRRRADHAAAQGRSRVGRRRVEALLRRADEREPLLAR